MNKTKTRSEAHSPVKTSSILQNKKNTVFRAISIAVALILWQVVSMIISSDILLVSPVDVVKRMYEMLSEDGFFFSVCFTFSRIAFGFLTGLLAGALLALIAGRFKVFEVLLWPYMVTIKSVPVASFVVIALVWIKSANLSALISFLMVLPIVYTNILEGIRSVDVKMLEMAYVFKMPYARRLKYIWFPNLKPFLVSAVSLSLGLAWKSGVAAELIGIPNGSVGEKLYYSKLFLNTADMFAWTAFIVILAVSLEKLFLFLLKKFIKGAGK